MKIINYQGVNVAAETSTDAIGNQIVDSIHTKESALSKLQSLKIQNDDLQKQADKSAEALTAATAVCTELGYLS